MLATLIAAAVFMMRDLGEHDSCDRTGTRLFVCTNCNEHSHLTWEVDTNGIPILQMRKLELRVVN